MVVAVTQRFLQVESWGFVCVIGKKLEQPTGTGCFDIQDVVRWPQFSLLILRFVLLVVGFDAFGRAEGHKTGTSDTAIKLEAEHRSSSSAKREGRSTEEPPSSPL
jgi:hypothetical protein